jgi:DNA-binding CsgD family transcriptional regulator
VFVTPVARDYPSLSAVRPVVCIMITDPCRRHADLSTRLRGMFGLTVAEARLADRLAAGEALRVAAAALGITYATARARLAEIFQKTDTHRQSELVSLLLGVATTE